MPKSPDGFTRLKGFEDGTRNSDVAALFYELCCIGKKDKTSVARFFGISYNTVSNYINLACYMKRYTEYSRYFAKMRNGGKIK